MNVKDSLNYEILTIILSLVTPGKIRSLKTGVMTSGFPPGFEDLKTKKIFDVPASITSSPYSHKT